MGVKWAKYMQKSVKITENSKNRLYKTSKLSTRNLITLETSINQLSSLQLRFNINITTLDLSLVCKKSPKTVKNSQKTTKMTRNRENKSHQEKL